MKVLVIGDSCQDVFVYGTCPRLCPDVPIPVFIPSYEKKMGGMALNVYENIKSLGVSCDIITNPIQVSKTRYVEVNTNQVCLRVDSHDNTIPNINNLFDINFTQYDAIVVSDYNKGFLSYNDLEYIFKSHPYVFIDTKKIINDKFKNAFLIKINHIEYNRHLALNLDLKEFTTQLIVTKGSKGAVYNNVSYPVKKVNIKDTTGAGDTFLSGLVSNFVFTKDISKAIKFGNKCSSIVVQYKGTNAVGQLKSLSLLK